MKEVHKKKNEALGGSTALNTYNNHVQYKACDVMEKYSDGKLVLIICMHVDDCLDAYAKTKWHDWFQRLVGTQFKYRNEGRLEKHLQMCYEWKTNENGEPCVEARMPKLVQDIIDTYEQHSGKVQDHMKHQESPEEIAKERG